MARLGFFDPDGPVLFDARDFDFDFETGYFVDLVRHGEVYSWQLRHFGLHEWSASKFFQPGVPFTVAFPGYLGNNFSQALFEYSSELYSTEANLRGGDYHWLSPLAGFRWIRLTEELSLANNLITPLHPSYDVDTHNDLYGFQVGGDIRLFESWWAQLIAFAKTGIYANQARNRITPRDAGDATLISGRIEEDRTTTSFVHEIGLNGRVKITDSIAISAGYMVMWISQLALAPSQLEQNSLAAGPTLAPTAPVGSRHIDTGDYLLIHGGQVALEFTW